MHYEKNLHAFVPPALLTRAQEAARQERISFELVTAAVEQRLSMRGLEEVLAFGKRHAKERGLKRGDVAIAIAEERRKNPARE
jgi:hypothetical protein